MKKKKLINLYKYRHFCNDHSIKIEQTVSEELKTAIQLLIYRLRESGSNTSSMTLKIHPAIQPLLHQT
jgi:hypothetical protein